MVNLESKLNKIEERCKRQILERMIKVEDTGRGKSYRNILKNLKIEVKHI
jgi:hypothetical protein